MFTIAFDAKRNCMIGVFKGMLTEEVFTACAGQITGAIGENRCHRFALDMRNADMIPNKIDFRKYYFILYKAGLDEAWKKVLVLSKSDFSQVTEIQKNLSDCPDMEIFGDAQQALQWLDAS